jgi:hypothetical protein
LHPSSYPFHVPTPLRRKGANYYVERGVCKADLIRGNKVACWGTHLPVSPVICLGEALVIAWDASSARLADIPLEDGATGTLNVAS